MLNLSLGTSIIDERPSMSIFQNEEESVASPGNFRAKPMTAMSSRFSECSILQSLAMETSVYKEED